MSCANCWRAAFLQLVDAWGIDGKVAAGEGESRNLDRKAVGMCCNGTMVLFADAAVVGSSGNGLAHAGAAEG